MAVNPYFTSSAQQYTPKPIEALWRMGAYKQQEKDKIDEENYKLQSLLGSVKAIDAHQPYKKALDEQWYNRLSGIQKKIEVGDKTVKNDLMKANIDWAKNPIRQELEESYRQYNEDQKKKLDLGSKYATWGDPNSNFQGSLPDGTINPYRSKPMLERQDHQKRAQEMMKDVKEWGVKTGNLVPDENGIYHVKKGSEYISDQFIRNLANSKVQDFVGTIEGDDYRRQFNAQTGKPVTGKDVSDYLYHAGANAIHYKTDDDMEYNLDPEWLHKEKKSDGSEYNYLNSSILPQNNRFGLQQTYDVSTGLTKAEINDIYKRNGLLDRNGNLNITSKQNWEKANAEIATYKNKTSEKPFKPDDLTGEQKVVYDKAVEQFGRHPSTFKDANKLVNDYLEWHDKQVAYYSVKDLDHTQQQDQTKQYFGEKGYGGTALTRNFKPMEGDVEAKEYTGTEFYDEYGDPQKYFKTVIGEMGGDNPFYPNAKIVTVTDTEGKPVAKFAMSPAMSTITPDAQMLSQMGQARFNASGRSEIELIDQGVSKKFTVDYEPITKSLDNNPEHYPIVEGHIVRLMDGDKEILKYETNDLKKNPMVEFYRKIQNEELGK